MNFLSPWSLLWFVPLAAAIIFLYLLKLKRTSRVVSSVMLWNKLVADLQANAPFQKLRRNLLLFLQLLALLIIVGTLARPYVRAKGFENQSLVVILDASASMKATDVSGSRFGEAKRIALKAVDNLGRGDTMMVIEAGAKTRVVTPFTSDKLTLTSAIDSMQCKDTTTRLDDALRLADSLCTRKKSAQIVVLSDGAFPEIASAVGSNAKVSFKSIGRAADNVAITSLGARRSLSGGANYEVFVATQNFSAEHKTFTIEISREGQLLDAREQTLAPGAPGAEVFSVPQSDFGLISAKLDIADDLAADNLAYTFLSARSQATVLLISPGDLFLERALTLDPSLKVFTAAAPPKDNKSYDMVVVEGIDNAKLPKARGYLFINATSPLAPVAVKGTLASPTIVDWNRADPVTRYLDFASMRIAQAQGATVKPWAKALVEAAGGTLIASGQTQGVRSIYVGWDLLQSDFPLRVAFPIFIANCVDWLAHPSTTSEQNTVHPGEVVSLTVPDGLAKVTLKDPAGDTNTISLAKGQNPLLIENTETAGLYQVEGKGLKYRFAVNLLNRNESNIKPREQMLIAGKPLAGSRGTMQTNKELWRWLVLAALFVVALEWVAYHKRP